MPHGVAPHLVSDHVAKRSNTSRISAVQSVQQKPTGEQWISRRREALNDTTLRHYHACAERRLDAFVTLPPAHNTRRELRRAVKTWRGKFFVFLKDGEAPPTNDVSERKVRRFVIYPKIASSFGPHWSARIHAGYRSITGTARLPGKRQLEAIDQLLIASSALASTTREHQGGEQLPSATRRQLSRLQLRTIQLRPAM